MLKKKIRRRKRRRSNFHRPGSFNVFTIIQSVSVFLGHDGITLNSEHLLLLIRFPPSSIAVTPPLPLSPLFPAALLSLAPQGMSECTVEWRREVGLALPNSISEEHGLRGGLPPKGRCRPAFPAPPAPHVRKQTSASSILPPTGLCCPEPRNRAYRKSQARRRSHTYT